MLIPMFLQTEANAKTLSYSKRFNARTRWRHDTLLKWPHSSTVCAASKVSSRSLFFFNFFFVFDITAV